MQALQINKLIFNLLSILYFCTATENDIFLCMYQLILIILSFAIVGTLEVRLMGCQDLLEEVPGRSKRDRDVTSSPTDLRTFMKGVTGRNSSKSYSVKDEVSNEIMAVIKLDNQQVAQTNWRLCSQQAWDQR